MRIRRTPGAAGVVLALACTFGAAPAVVAQPADDGFTWQSVAVPDGHQHLIQVSATSPANAWALGAMPTLSAPGIWQWDGAAWHHNPPTLARPTEQVRAVQTFAADDTWVLSVGRGSYLDHWDGTAWTRVRGPKRVRVNDMSARSATDISVVGVRLPGYRAVISRYDGTSWTTSRLPRALDGSYNGVGITRAPGSKKVFVSGNYIEPKDRPGESVGPSLLFKQAGDSWTRVRLPKGWYGEPAVTAVTDRNYWVLHQPLSVCKQGPPCWSPTEAWHRTGKTWTRTKLPGGSGYSSLAVNRDTVVAVGYSLKAGVLMAVRRGDTWRRTPTRVLGDDTDSLASVAAVPGGTFWAVGATESGTSLALLAQAKPAQ